MSPDAFTVLVVCTGNVNRSALGATLLERWAEWYLPEPVAAGMRVTSAGLGAPVGTPMGRRARMIAEALGADASVHRAVQLTEQAIRDADLVLVASARQRDDVLGQVPGALHTTFTIREAGRIAASLPDLPAPDSVAALRKRVEAIAQNRASNEKGDEDIIDPQGKDDEAYRLMARQEVPALARIAHTLFGMPQGEVLAYDAVAEAAAFAFAKDAASDSSTDTRTRPRGRRGVTALGRPRGTDRESASSRRALRVLHLDHTSVPGGAEFALLRMLQAEPAWSPFLLLAPSSEGLGVYADLPDRVPSRIAGVRQPAGVSAGGARAALAGGARVLAQAVATRCARVFRGADLVDANTARSAAYGALAARWSRTPFVVHLRDVVDPDALGRSGHALMVRVVLPRADGVIANSRGTLESARAHLRPGVLAEVIPSASGVRVGAAVGPTPSDDSNDGPVRTVGMLARIDPWKGQHLLLKAFARVYGRREVRLQLAGDAPFGHERHLAELRRRAEALGVAGQVDFLGHVSDIDALLARWDVAVQASTRPEPLGQNVLQYLAAGLAVVAADEGGPTEWIADGVNGLLVPPRDVDALASALTRLDTDAALRARLGAAAAATPGLLDDAAVTRAHAAFYERVVRLVAERRRSVVE
ncbi:glycosyltransferase [Agromyces albus]|uniref:glycosyltransferase n=1 Tax=Agromyces albus TaxID=205332 RepID=UPI0027D8FB64|nr:glycosyltransferase [Agromyces albus]